MIDRTKNYDISKPWVKLKRMLTLSDVDTSKKVVYTYKSPKPLPKIKNPESK